MTAQTCQCIETEVRESIARHRDDPGALIKVLQEVQEGLGHVPRQAQEQIAQGLGVSLAAVYGVVSFYSLFSLKPKGRTRVACCAGTACYVRGSSDVLGRLEHELGIKAGDTSDDGEFSLEVVRCLGACGLAPVMTVNKDTHARMKPDRVSELVSKYKARPR